jgi:xanthine dehydrogenase accessory factor
MSQSILELAYQLTQAEEAFVLATVVWCERPTSAKPGAQAIIRSNGEITGWIGGSCTQPIVVREATRLLREGGDPYVLRLGGSEHSELLARVGMHIVPMNCASGGVMDIYIEPHLPSPQLLLIGASPVITALSRLASVLDFSVTHLDHADLGHVSINQRTYILVASHGEYDEDVLAQALSSSAIYIGMVASHRRADACREYLRANGLPEAQLQRLKAPAGLDIGAVTPEEIAASILAELVQVQRRGQPIHDDEVSAAAQPTGDDTTTVAETALDPVCGMIVEIATARYHSSHNGRDFYFCCPSCQRLFERDPQKYLAHHPQ